MINDTTNSEAYSVLAHQYARQVNAGMMTKKFAWDEIKGLEEPCRSKAIELMQKLVKGEEDGNGRSPRGRQHRQIGGLG